MRLVSQTEYRRHTLLRFEQRDTPHIGEPQSHWLVIAPDGVNVLGPPQATEAAARSLVDGLVDSGPPMAPAA